MHIIRTSLIGLVLLSAFAAACGTPAPATRETPGAGGSGSGSGPINGGSAGLPAQGGTGGGMPVAGSSSGGASSCAVGTTQCGALCVNTLTDQANCIAVAVYHEARGESLEGQMAVAKVIMNRAASGKYPTSWCGVVKQPWQFSFVRHGQFPFVDQGSDAWRKALGVTRLAVANAVQSVPSECMWYHADYVAPSWGRGLTRVNKIGAHIFYRS